jgi:hypothetical protein
MSRRQFLATSAAATGAALTSPIWLPSLAEAGSQAPVPIPPNPGFFNLRVSGGPGTELSSIWDFRGVTAMATVQGTGTGRNTKTGKRTRYSFDSDNRFMQGEYLSADGERHRGTFAFVWLDVYELGHVDPLAPDTHQLHDFDPGIAPDGLFWTFQTSSENARVDPSNLGEGASLTIRHKTMFDYFNFANAFVHNTVPPDRAVVSFKLRWRGNTGPTSVKDPGPNRFRYTGIFTHASLEYSASNPSKHFTFQTDDPETSFETFAAIVNERNGRLYSSDDDDWATRGSLLGSPSVTLWPEMAQKNS